MPKIRIAAHSRVLFRNMLLKLLLLCSVGSLAAAVRVIPMPQYDEPVKQCVLLIHSRPVRIHLGPTIAAGNEKLRLSADFLRHDLEQADPSLRIEVQAGTAPESAGSDIYLWDYSVDRNPRVRLNFLDRSVLADPNHYGQSYVLRTLDQNSMWVVGSTSQGVMLGTMSVLQLIDKNSQGVDIEGAYIRDYPDFRYRAAADWLLQVEVNRWALDWGQGIDGYQRVCERKLDEALRFKINMVVFDGFGWGLDQRFAEYGELMRHLNQYARMRGIRLLYGGYGARYAMAASGEYMGRAWKNRVSYPDGPTYQCMGSDVGTCRANDELNHLKAEELRRVVQTVEPGALYIHHEDVSLNEFEPLWKQREAHCRKRWPNDSVTAPDGAAGGLAHLDSQLINAINSVKNPDGYDASRDCAIILVSPGYGADSVSSTDWSNTLELWRNIGRQLPRADNILICFGGSSISFTFPQEYGGEGWISLFNSMMAREGLHIGTYVFLCGGADNFYSDHPLTGTPVLNAIYKGATGMYNATGDFYREPMEIINAEYTWNTHSGGVYQDSGTFNEAMHLNLLYIYGKDQPPELFSAGGLFQRVCELLYGPKAGPAMEAYYHECAYVPDTQSEQKELQNLKEYGSAQESGKVADWRGFERLGAWKMVFDVGLPRIWH